MDTIRTRTRWNDPSFAPDAGTRGGRTRNEQRYRHVEAAAQYSQQGRFKTGRDSGRARRIDAGLYLQATCKLVQTASASGEAMECAVEDHGVGLVSEAVCRLLALVLCDLIRGASACVPADNLRRQIRIVLRRRGKIVLCAVESRWLTESGACAPAGIRETQEMIAALGASCLLRLSPERNLIAIMLDVEKAEPQIADAIAVYRLSRIVQQPVEPDVALGGYHA